MAYRFLSLVLKVNFLCLLGRQPSSCGIFGKKSSCVLKSKQVAKLPIIVNWEIGIHGKRVDEFVGGVLSLNCSWSA